MATRENLFQPQSLYDIVDAVIPPDAKLEYCLPLCDRYTPGTPICIMCLEGIRVTGCLSCWKMRRHRGIPPETLYPWEIELRDKELIRKAKIVVKPGITFEQRRTELRLRARAKGYKGNMSDYREYNPYGKQPG